jgi:hypothetical protein
MKPVSELTRLQFAGYISKSSEVVHGNKALEQYEKGKQKFTSVKII